MLCLQWMHNVYDHLWSFVLLGKPMGGPQALWHRLDSLSACTKSISKTWTGSIIWPSVLMWPVFTEKINSVAATERSFTVKMFTFQFFTLFSSLFYVAFFLGRYSQQRDNCSLLSPVFILWKENKLCETEAWIIFSEQLY